MKKTDHTSDTQKDDQIEKSTDQVQAPVVDEQTSEVAELTASLQRIQAEFINYKARVESEKATLSQFSKSQVIKDLLPVIDDLERALNHAPEELSENKWAQGVHKVYGRLQKQLEKLGVTKIEALNQPFDPNLHEAVSVEGEGDQQIVSEILQNGYMLSEHIIRHATVKVTNR
jgi:molecular chaperone GrpE